VLNDTERARKLSFLLAAAVGSTPAAITVPSLAAFPLSFPAGLPPVEGPGQPNVALPLPTGQILRGYGVEVAFLKNRNEAGQDAVAGFSENADEYLTKRTA
jgi:hypothetical protein